MVRDAARRICGHKRRAQHLAQTRRSVFLVAVMTVAVVAMTVAVVAMVVVLVCGRWQEVRRHTTMCKAVFDRSTHLRQVHCKLAFPTAAATYALV